MSELPAVLARSDVAECPIPLRDPDVSHIIAWTSSGADKPFQGEWSLINMPSERQKTLLRERRAAIGSVMKFNKARVAKAITDMLKCYFANIPKERREFEQLVTKFVSELQDIPTWAVELGCMQIRLGNAPEVSPDFPPTTIRVREVCLPPVNRLRNEANEIHKILMAKKAITYVEKPEDRKRIGDGLKALAQQLGSAIELEETQRDRRVRSAAEEARDRIILQEYEAAGVPPVYSPWGLVTPSMLKSLGRWPKAA